MSDAINDSVGKWESWESWERGDDGRWQAPPTPTNSGEKGNVRFPLGSSPDTLDGRDTALSEMNRVSASGLRCRFCIAGLTGRAKAGPPCASGGEHDTKSAPQRPCCLVPARRGYPIHF
jgi:hypothetical protein